MTPDEIAKALPAAINRVADALFQCATEQRRQTRLQERSVEISQEMLEMQRTNLAVTKHLEARLALEGTEDAGSAN